MKIFMNTLTALQAISTQSFKNNKDKMRSGRLWKIRHLFQAKFKETTPQN